jgi:hypothetical protein
MKTIEEILKELSDNLKLKLLNGDYKILQIKKYENKIEIDGFVLHLHADVSYPEHAFGIYAGSILDTRFYNSDIMKGKNRIKIENFFDLDSETLRMDAWRVWKKKEKEYMELKGKRDKQKKINALRKELEELEKDN